MAQFIYKAKEGPTKTVEGDLHAESRSAALAALDRMGYSPVWVREKPGGSDKKSRRFALRPVRQRDITILTRQLASLIRSGVPILRGLRTISDQTENDRLCRVVSDMESTVRDGSMLSVAMLKFPELFPALYVDMVRAGESGGILDVSLNRLADAREKEEDFRRKVQSAMAYPCLVLTVGVITVFVLLSFFLPRVVDLFDTYESLPLPTRILISTSKFFDHYWYWLVLIFLLTVAVFKRLISLERGRLWIDGAILKMPLISTFVQQAEISRFARTLSLLLDSGLPIDKSLDLSGKTLQNSVMRSQIDVVRRRVIEQGESVTVGLKAAEHFPAFVSNMTAVGEEVGTLENSLNEIAIFYEKEVDRQSGLITSLIEPILILAVGGIVGFIVAAMLLPIFELGTGL
jgi:type II secretory pathway component PulF